MANASLVENQLALDATDSLAMSKLSEIEAAILQIQSSFSSERYAMLNYLLEMAMIELHDMQSHEVEKPMQAPASNRKPTDTSVDALIETALTSLESAKMQALEAVKEAKQMNSAISRSNAELRTSQRETRRLIEQLVNG